MVILVREQNICKANHELSLTIMLIMIMFGVMFHLEIYNIIHIRLDI